MRKAIYIESILVDNDSYHISIFNNSGNLKMKGTFSSIDPMIPDGAFEFYNISNKYDKCIGNYQNGEIIGQWKIYKGDSIRIINYDSININPCKKLENDKHSDLFIFYGEYPTFRGVSPTQSFREYIAEERFYPPFEELFKITGRVMIQFAIDTSGNVCNPKIVKNANPNFDKEALRILKNSPKWKPVDRIVMFTFPFCFENE